MRDVIGRMRWGMMGGGYAGRYWKDEIGYDGRGDMRDGPPPRNRPGRAAVFGPTPPHQQRLGDRNGKRSTSQKKAGRQKRQTINEPKKRMLILYLTC